MDKVVGLGVLEVGWEQPLPGQTSSFLPCRWSPSASPGRSAPDAVQLPGNTPVPLTLSFLKLFSIAGVGWISWLPPHPLALVLTYSRDIKCSSSAGWGSPGVGGWTPLSICW